MSLDVEQWVWKYYELGLKPIPIKHKSKYPNIPETKPYFYNEIPKETIEQWIKEKKYENVALLGGTLICYDFDDPKSFLELGLNSKELIDTGAWVTETPKEPGRYHIVVGNKDNNKVTRKSKEGIELRANEHYWLVYPSVHPNGKIYNLLNTKNPKELTLPRKVNALTLYEKWILTLRQKRGTKQKFEKTLKKKQPFDKSPDCIRLAWEHGAKPGERYYTSIGLGSWLQQKGFPEEMTKQIVIQWFKDKCPTDGRPTNDIKNAVHVGYQGEYKTGCTFWKEKTNYCPYEDIKNCEYCDMIGKNKKDLLEEYKIFEKDEDGNFTGKTNKPRLAKLLLEADNRHYIVIKDIEQIYMYNKSYYESQGKQTLEQRINYYLGDFTTNHAKKEVIGYIRNHEYVTREDLQPQPQFINLKNGVYDFLNRELNPHTHENHFLYEIPVNYDPDAICPEIHKFIEETLNVEDIPLLQEMLGDCIQTTYKYKKALMVTGPTDTGKSQLLNLIRRFLGGKNLSHESLYDLCHNKFKAIELYGRLANICNELDPIGIKTSSTFLMVTGGDYISGEKKHMDPFKFLNYAKLIFACNKIPEAKNANPAYFRRWLVFQCDNQIPKEDQIPFLFETFSETELSGLLNYAIEGLERLASQGHYSEHQSLEEISEFMKNHGNPLVEFCKNITPDVTGQIKKKELYKKYLDFCNFFGYQTKTDNVFSRMIKQYLPKEYDDGYIGKERAWTGFFCTWDRKKEGSDNKTQVNKEQKKESTDGQQEITHG